MRSNEKYLRDNYDNWLNSGNPLDDPECPECGGYLKKIFAKYHCMNEECNWVEDDDFGDYYDDDYWED
jgi:hypothetical protein